MSCRFRCRHTIIVFIAVVAVYLAIEVHASCFEEIFLLKNFKLGVAFKGVRIFITIFDTL
tara:strand:+ start:119 stop:298 length:180 start_codon:yes stop_codon:yes gene_type:complete